VKTTRIGQYLLNLQPKYQYEFLDMLCKWLQVQRRLSTKQITTHTGWIFKNRDIWRRSKPLHRSMQNIPTRALWALLQV